MTSSQQMICVPREWLSAYLENDGAMVYVDGEHTSLWELLSNAVNSTQPDDQLEVELTDSPICFQHEEALLKLESEIERKERVIVDLRLQLAKRCDPCMWEDQQVLDFLGVALRNVDLVGEVRLSEIRQGFEFMRSKSLSVESNTPAELISEDDLRDLASSACQEALSFGVNEDVFLRLARSVELRARSVRER